jgi:hypothetical protein
MTTLPDWARNTLALAHALARASRFDDPTTSGPAIGPARPDCVRGTPECHLAYLRQVNEGLRAGTAHLRSSIHANPTPSPATHPRP